MSLIGQVSCYNQYTWKGARVTRHPNRSKKHATERDGKFNQEHRKSLNMHDVILTIAEGIKFE